MKKKFCSIFLMLIAGIFVFAGCGFEALKGGPSLEDTVYSNGGMVVQKGDYLYFVNGYKKTGDLKKGDNKFGDEVLATLSRVKINQDGSLEDYQVLAPKVVGFENCGFYIFGNKVYYASPYNEVDKTGKEDFTKTDFFVSNLDGTGVSKIYTTEVGSTSFKACFYEIENIVYLTVYDTEKLFIINTDNKNVKTVAESVSSVVMPKVSDDMTDAEKCVYYTRNAVDDDQVENGNILAYTKINDVEEVIVDKNSTYDVKDFKQDNLIYTSKYKTEANAYYYVAKIEDMVVKTASAKKVSYMAFTSDVFVLDFNNGYYNGMITTNAGGYLTLVKEPVGQVAEFEVVYEEKALTPITVVGNYVYAYDSEKVLYKVDYVNKTATPISESSENFLFDSEVIVKCDFNNNYIYVYKKFTGDNSEDSAYYLVRIKVNGAEFETQVVGKILDKHIKTEIEE